MYAIVEIAGKQFRVEKNRNLKVPSLQAESGSKMEFDRVLIYTDDDGKTQVGKPQIKNMKVNATVVEHGRDKKVVVFKKKRRKGYQKKNGHRQGYSLLHIDDIAVVKSAKKAEAKPKADVPKAAPVAEVKPAAKKAAPKTAKAKTASKATKPKAAAKTAKPKAAPKKAKPKAATKKTEPKDEGKES